MYKTRKPTSKGLKSLFVITGIVALLFIASLVLFAFLGQKTSDADLASFPNILQYYLNGIIDLFLFRYAGNVNIGYFALSCFLYALIVCWIIFLIGGIIVAHKKKRRIMWWGVTLTFVSLLVYILFAAGSQKYWHILNAIAPFDAAEAKPVFFVTIAVVVLALLHILLSVVSYFWSIIESYRNPKLSEEELKDVITLKEDDAEWIRRIVRDELQRCQPFKVIIVNKQKKEEVVEAEVVAPEEEPEPVFEEPVKEEAVEETKQEVAVMPKVRFWDIAREVWPQLDNPKPLPVVEQVETYEEDYANKKPRDPFITRILKADLDIKANYNEIKNELLSYGLKSRLSRSGDTFQLHRNKYARIYLVGKTLKVYLALNPEDYKDSTFPIEDVGHRPNYAEMPLLFKVRSGLSVRRCKALIKAAMDKAGFAQKEVENTNWVSEMRSLNAEKAKEKKAD